MSKRILFLFAVLFYGAHAISAQDKAWAWSVKPFDHKVYVQNAGQFDNLINETATVKYMAQIGDNLFVYFTTNGIIFKTVDFPKTDADSKEEMANANTPILNYLNAHWENCNPNVIVDGQLAKQSYYTYPTSPSSSVQVSIYKQITYHNLYNGIDAQFTFPTDTTGFEYALIVHPGADLSQVKLQYSGSTSMIKDVNGNIVIQSPVGEIIDHAPNTYYQTGGNVSSSYNLNGTEESFSVPSYDNTKTLVVDPWTWSHVPGMATTKAYDIDFDNQGNVYVYGSSSTWQLEKYSSAGTLLWTYNATPISTGYFGDFACIRTSGKCICTEGFNSSGMEAVEVNTSGAQIAANRTTANMQEGWKIVWNPCVSKVIVGGGGWSAPVNAGGWIDTNCVITQKNVLNQSATAQGHDIALTCYDPTGQYVYMASTKSVLDPTNFDNVIIQIASATLTPPTYYAPTGFGFAESNVPQYISGGSSNGLNSMWASFNWLYIYNGATLKRCVKNTGAVNATVTVTATVQQWGGLFADACDNVYVGENSAIQVYNSSLVLTTTYTVTSTIYALMLDNTFTHLYACGNGFVCAMPLTAPTCVHPAICTATLPVSLSDFKCAAASGGIQLNWTTASETNNKFFTIERSIDGINFQPLANVNGAGNTSTAHNYSYLDKPSTKGTYYYRLSQTDYDGNSQTFDVTSCDETGPIETGRVYPNPNPGKFTVTIDNTVTGVQIYNAIGQKVYDKTLVQNYGPSLNVDLSSQAPGIYVMNIITANGQNIVRRINIMP